jgi:hypothetical protein
MAEAETSSKRKAEEALTEQPVLKKNNR